MEFLKKLFIQTQTHLKGLTASQYLAIGSCVVLIMVAMVGLVRWAATPQMVPLVDQALSTEDNAKIQQRLDALGEHYKVAGDIIMVPQSNRYRLLARLEQGKILPGDISMGFSNLIENSSPWLSQDELRFRRGVARANEISAVLREFDGIVDAKVFIDEKTRRMVGQPSVTPTASVWVKPASSRAMTKELVHGLAGFVSKAVAGLEITNVAITDATTGISHTVPDPRHALTLDDLQDRIKKEQYFAGKIKDLLSHIPGVLVAVQANLSAESMHVTESKYDDPVITEDETESTLSERIMPDHEPGVIPNAGVALSTAGSGSRQETKSSRTRFTGQPSSSTIIKEKPRHDLEGLSAAIIVPRSYLAAIYQRENEGQEPSDAELEAASRNTVLAKIEQQVQRALDIASEDVQVDWFHDEASVRFMVDGALAEAGIGGDMMGFVRAYGSRAGLAVLAVMSMVMMLMMVRRVSEGPILPGEEPPSRRKKRPQDVEALPLEGQPVGEASVSEQALEGLEVDPSVLKVQHMIEQINEMVSEDPDISVSILERWIQQDQV